MKTKLSIPQRNVCVEDRPRLFLFEATPPSCLSLRAEKKYVPVAGDGVSYSAFSPGGAEDGWG